MNKIFSLFIAASVILISQNLHSLASDTIEDKYIPQGSHFVIDLEDESIQSASASFHEKKWPFFAVSHTPQFDEAIYRGEFISLLFQSTDLHLRPRGESSYFPDLPSYLRNYEEIIDASAMGIIHGYANGDFGPFDPLTRAQIAKILNNSFDLEPLNKKPISFPDVSPDHDLGDHIEAAVRAGIFQGYPDGLMRPDRPIRIDEAQTVLTRLTENKDFELYDRTYFKAYIGVHRLWAAQTEPLNIEIIRHDLSTEDRVMNIHIQAREFKTVRFNMAEEKEELLDKEYQDTTWEQINAAKTKPHPVQLWENSFIIPAVGETTLGFGDKLYINGKYSGSHFGHDWANVEGTDVIAANTGIVTLAEWTDSYGYTIVIDHGLNVFSMYLHMSALKTEAGNVVDQGELIGLIGSTGVATGPHLHYTQFIGEVIVDSAEWRD